MGLLAERSHPLTLSPLIGESIEAAWGFWLTQHPVSLDNMVTGAVEAAIRKWLESNTDELLGRIAAEVARRVPPPDTKTGGVSAG